MEPEIRERQRDWLIKVIAATGLAPTALAVRAGLAGPTLTRFLNDPEHSSALSHRTITAIENATGLNFGDAALDLGAAFPFAADLARKLAQKGEEIHRLRTELTRRDRAFRHLLMFLREMSPDDLAPFSEDDREPS